MHELTEEISRSHARLQLATEFRLQAAELKTGAEGLLRLREEVHGAINLDLQRSELLSYLDKRLIDINSATENMLANADYYEQTALDDNGGSD
ncbi:MAG: hypothetical protein WD397_08965 [Wenzhouxiangellaceae bacterium]